MTTQPIHTLPNPTHTDEFTRPALMGALALAERLVAAPVPTPDNIRIDGPISPGDETIARFYLHHNLDALYTWQAAFGGEITHKLHGADKVYSALTGRVYDAPFVAWTLRDLSPGQQVAERQMCVRWCAEHGPFEDWAAETRSTYSDLVLRFRAEVAA